MNTYVVTRDGIEVGRYNSDVPVEWTGWEFATHDHIALPVQQPPVVQPQLYVWSNLAFLRKFDQAERIACREGRKTNPILDDFFSLLEIASEVRSDDAMVSRGLGYLVSVELITEARMTEILGTA